MFVAWRDLRFSRGRFALIGAVLVLITMLVGLLSGLTGGLARESTSAVTDLSADHLVFSPGAETFNESSVSVEESSRWADRPDVVVAEPMGIAPANASAGDRSIAITLLGIQSASEVSGLRADVTAGSAVLSETAAEDLAVGAGDAVTVLGHRLVVGAVEGDASFSHTPVIWTQLDDWQSVGSGGASAGDPPAATVIALQTRDSFDGGGPAQVRTLDDSLAAIGSYTAENGSLQLIRGFLFVISAVVVGAFFTVWTLQRSGDVAVLKALGASDGYLLRDALGQALVLLVAGTALGTGLAVAAGALAQQQVPFVLDAATIAPPVLGMVALGGVGAALPLRRLAKVDPLIALGSAR